MDEFTNARHLNATCDSWATSIAKAIKIKPHSSSTGFAQHTFCPNCKSQTIGGSLNSSDLLDLNWKRHFCSDPDRIAHEEKCVTQVQKIIEYYNRRELSSFQLELNIP